MDGNDILAKIGLRDVVLYGGCATRDAFQDDLCAAHGLRIKAYVARSVLASFPHRPFSFPVPTAELSGFYRRCIEVDSQKTALRIFKDVSKTEVIFCDFVSSARSDLFELERGEIGTLTNHAKIFLDAYEIKYKTIKNFSEEFLTYQDQGMNLMIAAAQGAIRTQNFIVNQVYCARKYNHRDKINKNREIDEKLAYIYRELEKKIGKIPAVTYEEAHLIGDVDHQWGKSNVHFIGAFYERQIDEFLNLTRPRSQKSAVRIPLAV